MAGGSAPTRMPPTRHILMMLNITITVMIDQPLLSHHHQACHVATLFLHPRAPVTTCLQLVWIVQNMICRTGLPKTSMTTMDAAHILPAVTTPETMTTGATVAADPAPPPFTTRTGSYHNGSLGITDHSSSDRCIRHRPGTPTQPHGQLSLYDQHPGICWRGSQCR